jgi:predicted ATP-dependent endonuclease of OLD family
MKIKRLDLKAFGPFTNQTLEFKSKDPGLHIIFGPNEAGKSSSLRALKALLYGFPERTPDNFKHPNDQLLVGGCLESSGGSEIVFQRRKKRKADVIDEAGDPLDLGALNRRFLNRSTALIIIPWCRADRIFLPRKERWARHFLQPVPEYLL